MRRMPDPMTGFYEGPPRAERVEVITSVQRRRRWSIRCFQSELGTTIIAPPPIYFHDHAACEAVAGKLTETTTRASRQPVNAILRGQAQQRAD